MSDYPEHEKMTAVQEQSQAVGEFLEWLQTPTEHGGKGVSLHTWEEWEEDDTCLECAGTGKVGSVRRNSEGARLQDCPNCDGTRLVSRPREGWMPVGGSANKLLAEFFGIDLNKIEDEKRAMLDQIRASAL